MVINGETVSDNAEMADKLNRFFVNSIVYINQSIGSSDMIDGNVQPRRSSFEFKNVSMGDIRDGLHELKNKRNKDFISPRMIIDALPIIGTTVCEIINESLSEACPEVWKITMVVPVPKVPRPKTSEEYRPINMEKLLKTVIKNQLVSYIEENHILSTYQSG